MPEPRSQNWQSDIPASQQTVDVESHEVGTVNKKSFLGSRLFWTQSLVVIASVVVWQNIVSPLVEIFYPEYGDEIPAIQELLEASKKNCKRYSYNRRGCKAVWAGVRIPEFTAEGQ